jgi:hypothetical protein
MIAGGTGALAALTAGALAHSAPAQAANGGPILLGQANAETSATTVSNSSGSDALSATVPSPAGWPP